MRLSKRPWPLVCFLILGCARASLAADRVTILYDAFGESGQLTKDWGFSALIEHHGKTILFDSGNNAEIFEKNTKALSVDLTKLDLVVISHRHTDHTSGLQYLLKVNPQVPIYVPANGADGFGDGEIPMAFYRPETDLPAKMRYYSGAPPAQSRSGKRYEVGKFVLVGKQTEILPGVFLLFTVSRIPGTLELPELTLAIKTRDGLLLVDGCSHAGIEEILKAASAVDPRVHIVFGGLHLVGSSPEDIDALVARLKNTWHVAKMAPGHCTGEPAFLRLQKAYAENYVYAGLGSRITVE